MTASNTLSFAALAVALTASVGVVAATWPHRPALTVPAVTLDGAPRVSHSLGIEKEGAVIRALNITDLQSRDDAATAMLQCAGFLRFTYQEAAKGRAPMPAEGEHMAATSVQLEDFGMQHASASLWSDMRAKLQITTGIDYARNGPADVKAGVSSCHALLSWQTSGRLAGLGSEAENFGYRAAELR